MKVADPHVREVLHAHLKRGVAQQDAVVIDELVLTSVEGRVDVTVVNSHLHGYEIKSDVDTLTLLKGETKKYGNVMDFLTVVVTRRHLAGAQRIVPQFWGVCLYEAGCIEELRQPVQNDFRSVKHLAPLLWKDTALALLKQHDADKGLHTKAKHVLHKAVIAACTPDQVHAAVISQFRNHWRKRAYAPALNMASV